MSRGSLWFAASGGSLAWLFHLLAAYGIAEFGCVAGWGGIRLFGMSLVGWLLVAISILSLGVATAASVVARKLQAQPGSALFVVRTGLILDALFAFIILAESLPIVYLLKDC